MSRSRSTCRSKSKSTTAFPTLEVEIATIVGPETPMARPRKPEGYVHRPRLSILAWLSVSLPLIAWDTLYVLLRPHTMPGGKLHSPLWTPYALYGAVDFIYGWPAWNGHVGFTAAQSVMNGVESAFYGWYLYVVGLQAADRSYAGISQLKVKGEGVSLAVLLAFSGAVMTVSKTMLYWLNEAFSGFDNIGHNSLYVLIVLWIIPNGAWIVVPSYMIYVLGNDILESMNGGSREEEQGPVMPEKRRIQ